MSYNHAYTIGFEVSGSEDPDGEDVTPARLREALLKRIADLDATPEGKEWLEAVGAPYDTYEETQEISEGP